MADNPKYLTKRGKWRGHGVPNLGDNEPMRIKTLIAMGTDIFEVNSKKGPGGPFLFVLEF